MSHLHQTQHYCRACQTHTLHTQPEIPFNHVLHLLLAALLCGCWFPVWLLYWFTHNPFPDTWRCTRCGQAADQQTPQEQYALAVQRAKSRQELRQDVKAKAAAIGSGAKQVGAFSVAKVRGAGEAVFPAIAREFRAAPRRFDAALGFMAGGPENTILHWFLRIVAGFILVSAAAVLAWAGVLALLARASA